MGKKKNAKKGGGDDYWDEAGEEVPPVNGANGSHDPESDNEVAPLRKSAFAAMTIEDPEDGGDEGGNMDVDGGKKQDNIRDAKPTNGKAEGKAAADDDDGEDDKQDDGTPRLLTKKEKERLKKEKEKAKKKQQAAAKRAAAGEDDAPSQPTPEAPAASAAPAESVVDASAAGADEDDEGDEDGGATAADKKKKKKKKKGAVPEAKSEPAAPSKKKPSAALQALQAQQAAIRKAEEEARQAEEEARRREEEAERLEKEEEERKEADRLRRKEKEKAKRDQLKKEGKLLTPKQKAEKAAAEARMQHLIASGTVKVDGLLNREKGTANDGDSKERRRGAASDRKKKKGPSGPPSKLAPVEQTASMVADEKPSEKEVAVEAEQGVEPETSAPDEPIAADVEEETSDEDVKDDWDAESDDEETKAAKAAAAAEKAKAAAASKNAATEKKPARVTASAAQAKPSHSTESSSEEDSDEGSSDDSDDSDDSEEEESAQQIAAKKAADAEKRRREKHEAALREADKDNLRSPICCIMGHVDTGKTKLLDKIRQTNVQGGEAGGITQQIGATYFPEQTLRQKIAAIDPEGRQDFKIPGLLVIDTPGHESFTNLRKRGSNLCNIAILVVDIMHGLEQQTLESIRLLRDRKTPFIVALNKIDRLYGWKATPDGAFRDSLAKQTRATQSEFDDRLQKTIVLFAEQGLNAVPYYDNKNFAKNVSLVPTSAHTGEGIPDMLQLLVNLTQDRMTGQLMYLSELECTVLEVKVIEGLGTTIDVILSNGVMHEGDKIVIATINGPVVTQVRALLTPQPLKEMRVKGSYVHHKVVKAALGVKISAPELDGAIAGTRLLVCGEDDDEEELKKDVMSDLSSIVSSSVDKTEGGGVWVQSSTLGSLEALIELLKEKRDDKKPVPIKNVQIGPLTKHHVRTFSAMTERFPDFAVMLCFDVDIEKEAEKLAGELGIKIFNARIIYHLYDNYEAHRQEVIVRKQKEHAETAVWPCRLKILAVFAKRSPIIVGCEILAGDLRLGTPLCVKRKESGEVINLGRVTSLEVNHKRMDVVTAKTAGAGVAVRIECAPHESARTYGRHFDESDELMSHISRQSIDTLKDLFWDQVSTDQKKTIKYLKTVLSIS